MFPKKLILVLSALVVIDLHGQRAGPRKRGHPARPIKPTSPVSGEEMCTSTVPSVMSCGAEICSNAVILNRAIRNLPLI